ncbi:MAG TPA: hypothetical protein DCS07_12795 [Bdellovibrionales bacterium]|nr:hypothetical protein [Bdellovibrionales bacterium]
MGNGLEYKELYMSESFGSYGGFGIKILVAATRMPDLRNDAICSAAYKAAGIVSSEVQGAALSLNEEAQERARQEREQLLGLFSGRIFVEELPNGYCSDWCCRHLPWFVVTTEVGRFKIGWRKRVINIDWSETVGTKTAEELFPSEDVTKWEQSIHAWSLDDAKRYIEKIVASAERL